MDALYKAKPRQYVGLACLVCCYLDAAAARGGRADKDKFLSFLRNNFKQLCAGLDGHDPVLDGAGLFYKYYRSGMVHTFFGRNGKYAIAEDAELGGAYAGPVPGTAYIGVNVDRLYRDFRALAKRRARWRTL